MGHFIFLTLSLYFSRFWLASRCFCQVLVVLAQSYFIKNHASAFMRKTKLMNARCTQAPPAHVKHAQNNILQTMSYLLAKHWVECVGFEIVLIIIFLLSKGDDEVRVSLGQMYHNKATCMTKRKSVSE